MSKANFFLAIALAAGVAVAQSPRNQGKGGMGGNMHPGMNQHMGMSGSMPDPLHEAAVAVFGLPRMRVELGLSTQQETQLRQFKDDLLKKGQDLSAQIAAKRTELTAAARADKTADVKQLLEQVAALEAQRQFAAFETAGKMKGALTAEQRNKLTGHDVHHAMMMRMTMGEMQQMMQFMGGRGMGMMGMGMMGPGMSGMGMPGRE